MAGKERELRARLGKRRGGRGGKAKRGDKRGYRIYGDRESKPYGVGKDFEIDVTNHLGAGPKGRLGRQQTNTVGPRYFSGAATEIFGSMPSGDLTDVQIALWRLGWLPEEEITGTYSRGTGTAVSQMLANANATGLGWKRWLRDKMGWLDKNGIDSLGSSGGDRELRPLTIELTNPDSIRSDVMASSAQMLGGNYAGDPQQYVDEIHRQERAQQTEQYVQTGGATGEAPPRGTSYTPATVQDLILKKHGTEYRLEQLGQNAQAIIGTLTARSGDSRG